MSRLIQENLQGDDFKEKVKLIRKEMKDLTTIIHPITPAVIKFVCLWLYGGHTRLEATSISKVSTGKLSIILAEPAVKTYIDGKKEEIEEQHITSMAGLIEKAIEVLYISLDEKSPQIRLKAAELVLKRYGLLTEQKKIELSGSLALPEIKIITERSTDE